MKTSYTSGGSKQLVNPWVGTLEPLLPKVVLGLFNDTVGGPNSPERGKLANLVRSWREWGKIDTDVLAVCEGYFRGTTDLDGSGAGGRAGGRTGGRTQSDGVLKSGLLKNGNGSGPSDLSSSLNQQNEDVNRPSRGTVRRMKVLLAQLMAENPGEKPLTLDEVKDTNFGMYQTLFQAVITEGGGGGMGDDDNRYDDNETNFDNDYNHRNKSNDNLAHMPSNLSNDYLCSASWTSTSKFTPSSIRSCLASLKALTKSKASPTLEAVISLLQKIRSGRNDDDLNGDLNGNGGTSNEDGANDLRGDGLNFSGASASTGVSEDLSKHTALTKSVIFSLVGNQPFIVHECGRRFGRNEKRVVYLRGRFNEKVKEMKRRGAVAGGQGGGRRARGAVALGHKMLRKRNCLWKENTFPTSPAGSKKASQRTMMTSTTMMTLIMT